ncbi:MAG: methyltransferase domain-containing protein [Pseudomonadota bacterium]
MADQTKSDDLWTPRSVEDTKAIYADWADTYEADVTGMAYATPSRVAAALRTVGADTGTVVLDFGCGTGLSGQALIEAGFAEVDGTDISPEMLAHAEAKGIYRKIWLGTSDSVDVAPGTYAIIVATGVVSLGAAPPEMLGVLLDLLEAGGLLAFSYNDPTLADAQYIRVLDALIAGGRAALEFREHGPHLNDKVTGSDVIVLRKL